MMTTIAGRWQTGPCRTRVPLPRELGRTTLKRSVACAPPQPRGPDLATFGRTQAVPAERENISHACQPCARFWAANSPYPLEIRVLLHLQWLSIGVYAGG